jgi:hypothetical protein
MSVIIKYQLDFTDIGLKVSNDAFAGDFILDADINASMSRGASGATFDIKIYDLPNAKAQALHDQLKTSHRGKVNIKLGYMDDPSIFGNVMEGIYTKVTANVEGDHFVTSVKGMESGTHALTRTAFQNNVAGSSTVQDALKAVLSKAVITEGEISTAPAITNVDAPLQDAALRGDHLMDVIDRLAEMAQAELVVVDKRVSLGKPVTDDSYKPKAFSRDSNLATFQPFAKEVPEDTDINLLEPVPPTDAIGFHFKIFGDPKLRPGQSVVTDLTGFNSSAGTVFRVHSVVHSFSSSTGYVCDGVAVKICTDDRCRRLEDAISLPTADAVVQGIAQKVQQKQKQKPSVEVGAVKAYSAGSASDTQHTATLYYGQKSRPSETQPSIRTDVQRSEDQLMKNKPILSPFAWRKCGLVTPVYPGMKAALIHNLDLQDDALVAGFLWPNTPAFPPPANKAGDWWLCLPVDVDGSAPPADSTSAANDLTAVNGKRVIEAKGLRITIGTSKLRTVGVRPEEGADDEFLIEHSSGTTLTISSDGTLTIQAQSVSIKGNLTVEGNVEIR